ncbi:hypothetical protein WMY93_010444 [Mugilogobius chulae]|uniref:Dynein regulatory complex protein 1 C-terminal domain-containing protein n=1 Tax=Mugilogobius chulae TaxID=88201 RepID=A0AAW0P7S0_9GOBI
MEKLLIRLSRAEEENKRLQRKRIHLAVSAALKYERMWLSEDAELQKLLEKVLYVDKTISEQVLQEPWENAEMQKRMEIYWASSCSQDQVNVGYGTTSSSEEEVENSAETPRSINRLLEILCGETGFLIDVKIVKLLDTLDDHEQTPVKMGFLFHTLGLEERDLPDLVDFLIKYSQREDRLEAESTQSRRSTHNPIEPSDVLQALTAFLNRPNKNGHSRSHWSVQTVNVVRNMSPEQNYWRSLASAIPEDKQNMWRVTKMVLKKYLSVLSSIPELSQDVMSLQQENKELQAVQMWIMGLNKASAGLEAFARASDVLSLPEASVGVLMSLV